MSSSASDQRVLEAPGAQSLIGTGSVRATLLSRVMTWFDKYLLVLVLGGFVAGIGIASISQPVVDQVDSTINLFMGVYE